jgi:hypothetical protein
LDRSLLTADRARLSLATILSGFEINAMFSFERLFSAFLIDLLFRCIEGFANRLRSRLKRSAISVTGNSTGIRGKEADIVIERPSVSFVPAPVS